MSSPNITQTHQQTFRFSAQDWIRTEIPWRKELNDWLERQEIDPSKCGAVNYAPPEGEGDGGWVFEMIDEDRLFHNRHKRDEIPYKNVMRPLDRNDMMPKPRYKDHMYRNMTGEKVYDWLHGHQLRPPWPEPPTLPIDA